MTSIPNVNAEILKRAQQQIQQDLQTALDAFSLPEPLKSAVHHTVMLGGKRVRPALCYAISHLKENNPKKGSITLLTVTEKQFSRMIYLNGKRDTSVASSDSRLVFLGEAFPDEI